MFPVTVSSGLIVHENRILIGKKQEGYHPADLGGKWVLPGGRVEIGESASDALLREVIEETFLRVHIEEAMGEYTDIRSNGSTRIFYFRCSPITVIAKPGDDLQTLLWVDHNQAFEYLDSNVTGMFSPELHAWFTGMIK